MAKFYCFIYLPGRKSFSYQFLQLEHKSMHSIFIQSVDNPEGHYKLNVYVNLWN